MESGNKIVILVNDVSVFILLLYFFFVLFFLNMMGFDVFCVCDNKIGLCFCIILRKDLSFLFLIIVNDMIFLKSLKFIDNLVGISCCFKIVGVVKIVGELSLRIEYIFIVRLDISYDVLVIIDLVFRMLRVIKDIGLILNLFFDIGGCNFFV